MSTAIFMHLKKVKLGKLESWQKLNKKRKGGSQQFKEFIVGFYEGSKN